MPYKFNPFTGTFDDSTAGPAGTVSAAGSGTAAAPGIAFASDPNTGIYNPGADQLGIATNGTGRLFVDASGNVGVKTSSPFAYGVSAASLANLQVEAELFSVITLGSTTGGVGQKYWRIIGRGNALQIQSMNDNGTAEATAIQINKGTAEAISNVQFYTNGVQRLQISGDSAVGGTATPTSLTLDNTYRAGGPSWDALKLNLFKSATEAYGFGVGSSEDLHYYAGGASTGVHAFYTSRTERLRLTSDGYVRLAAGTGGIQFNGDTAAANALDDYEEGTWTPQFSFATPGDLSVSYHKQVGYYRIVGKLCIATFVLEFTPTYTTASGTARVSGLPLGNGTYLSVTASVYRFSGFAISDGLDNLWLRKSTGVTNVEVDQHGRSGSSVVTTTEATSGSAKILNGTIIFNLT